MMDGQKVVKVFCHEEQANFEGFKQAQRRSARQRGQAPTAMPTPSMPLTMATWAT
ncbi:MAG: hypothetical protein ACLUHE_15760 [Christensenellales bacterium]